MEGGTYTITITGLPADASFDATTAEVTIAQSGQSVTRNFAGAWVRTASLMGMVTVEGEGLPGITVSITGRQEDQMVTDDNGQYTFTGLRAGNYTVEITGFDATGVAFSATSSAVEVSAGESKVWSFDGTYVRESAIAGQVSVEGNGLSDVTVSLQGMGADDTEMTDAGGQFTFSNLRAGEYQLAISGFDAREYGFSTTSATIRLEHGRTANVPFEGIMLRTAAIMGQISVEGEGLEDVTVSLSGEGENQTAMTDESGHYTFSDLPAGNFQVGISGYDTDDYSFETTSKNVALALGETATVPFEGTLLRTSGIAGRVSVGGTGIGDVTVTLSGAEERTETTDATGQYAISGLAAGDYTVTISGYDALEYSFEDSQAVPLDMDQTRIVNFAGKSLRTAAVAVMVTADGDGVAGVTATLYKITNLVTQQGSIVGARATGADGGQTFSNLLAGAYLVQITGADAEIDFAGGTSMVVNAMTDMTAEANFPGMINRTASISGTVMVDGAGKSGVMVMLSGDEGDMTRETDADGAYSFTGLRRGDYTVSITNPNEAMYSFTRTSQEVDLGLAQAPGDVSFAGSLIMQSSINGQVSVGGSGLKDVTVTLSGAADDTDTTGESGLYSFTGLATGSYTVTISAYDAEEYSFASASEDIELGNSDDQTENFSGTSLRTASVTVIVTAEGTGVARAVATLTKTTGKSEPDRTGATDADGMYTFGDLLAGTYQVDISGTDEEIDFGDDGTSWTGPVATDATAEANFPGMINRTASISGTVMVDGAGKSGVMVMLSGDEGEKADTTDADGAYSFTGLRRGDYTVSITNPNEAMYSFTRTSQEVDLGLAQAPGDVSFAGSLIMQSSINGQVSVGGSGLEDVTVTLSGAADDTDTTGESGLYSFTGLATGSYTVTISAYDAEEYSFASESEDIELGNSDEKTENFSGTSLRTASVTVTVTAEGAGVARAVATLTKTTGKSEPDRTGATDADGMYTFGDLLAGTYQVDISGTDEEIDFGDDGTSWTGPVATDATAEAAFPGTYNRTASIAGTVTIDGAGMADVVVMLSGDEGEKADTTDADGAYSFPGQRRGEYTVSITNPDEAMYDFRGRTSQKVDLALGQAQTDVSFAGSMVQQSSISGQVTVEGAALPGVTVTLGGAGDDTRTTGDDGLYAFLNLGSGTYTVSMANPDAAAYSFDTDSVEIMLGNTDEQSHDFDGDHTREANISGMLFVDEGTKNDLHDEGEEALAAEDVKVMLVGPTLLMRDSIETNADGMFTFPKLRQGTYQLMLALPDAAVMDDFGYGGEASYTIAVGVGADGGATQNLPFDITHQTVNFTVNLRSGEDMGDALPGAMITLFSDAAGQTQIDTATTTDVDGMASIRFERARRTANTVYAAIAAPAAGDYDADGGKQAVTWDSQHRMTDAANAADIVNLKAEINFGAATVETDFGGGVALGGWAISVTSDKSAGADAPAALGANGTASYPEVVVADSLPVTYTVKMAGNQLNELDGGEKYEADSLMHAHDGLSLPAAVEMGMMEVTYITQTLKVYVHHERDQVMGFTGNILGGDERASGRIDVEIRHLDANGRSRAFASSPASARVRKSESKGVVTFSNVPAAANVVVNADEVQDSTVTLLDPDELAAYEDVADNGITGGAFGTNGGYHHTVELCPLQATDPSGQDHGECATFAYVNTYAVHGQVWKNAVYPDPANDGFKRYSRLGVPGTSVAMEPVDGKNIAGDPEYFTAAAADNRRTPQNDSTEFVWGRMAAGVYTVAATPGWVAQRGTPTAATNDLAGHINPLAGDLQIDVTPATGFVYGRVVDDFGFAVADVIVAVNGRTATSDAAGRYAVEGFLAQTRRIGTTIHRNKSFVQTNTAGHNPSTQVVDFAANTPREEDITLVGATKTASVSGTVRSSGTGLPLKGVRIMVNGKDPLGVTAAAGLKTDDNGLYTATVAAVGPGQTVTVTASMARMSFTPSSHAVSAVEGSAISGIDFTGFNHATVSGRVSTAGRPMDGVLVSATPAGGGPAADTATTGVTGTYSLSLAFGQYDVRATKAGFTFNPATQRVNVGPGESKSAEKTSLPWWCRLRSRH